MNRASWSAGRCCSLKTSEIIRLIQKEVRIKSQLLKLFILDFVIILVMTCSLGKGCMFSAIPVFVFEGAMTLLAALIRPFMTEAALANLSLIGSILIFCVGLNLVWGKKVRVANLLPSIILAVIWALV